MKAKRKKKTLRVRCKLSSTQFNRFLIRLEINKSLWESRNEGKSRIEEGLANLTHTKRMISECAIDLIVFEWVLTIVLVLEANLEGKLHCRRENSTNTEKSPWHKHNRGSKCSCFLTQRRNAEVSLHNRRKYQAFCSAVGLVHQRLLRRSLCVLFLIASKFATRKRESRNLESSIVPVIHN